MNFWVRIRVGTLDMELMMKRELFLIMAIILAIGLLGCSEEKEEPAKILETNPASGSSMFANGNLIITFDMVVTEVMVNGILADIDDAKATWKGLGLKLGNQTLVIEWTDVNGNNNSQEINLTIQAVNTIICFRRMVIAASG